MNVFYLGYNDQTSLVLYLQTIFCCNVTNLFRLNIYKDRPIKYSRETESKKILSSYDTIEKAYRSAQLYIIAVNSHSHKEQKNFSSYSCSLTMNEIL